MAQRRKTQKSNLVFKISNDKSYTIWDDFCVESLKSAKEEINQNRILRYKCIADVHAEQARLRQVTAGIEVVTEFIGKYGWALFVVIALTFVGGVVGLATPAAPFAGIALVGVSYYGYKLFKHKQLVLKVKNVLSPIKGEFKKYQPGNKKKNRSKMHILFNQSVVMVIENVYECEIMVNDLSLPINPICLCGAVLTPKSNEECYGNDYSYVICDICNQTIRDKKDVYHCPNGQTAAHPHGYDVCIRCARANNTKYKRYHAVIIQTLPENGQHIACKDAVALKSLFEALNYHEVIIVKEHDANQRKIKIALNRMALNQGNDVVVICYSGHGIRRNNRWLCSLETGETVSDQQLVQWVKCNDTNIAFGETCDVVILLNACHSGQFRVNNQLAQPEVDDEKMPQYLADYNALGRNMITIAACASEENANFFGKVSPFYKLVIEEITSNKNATPQTVHQYIENKSNEQMDLGIRLSEIQNVQRAYKRGEYALYVPLCPAVKPY